MTEEIIARSRRRIPRWAWITGAVILAFALLAIVPRLIVRYQISAELKALKAQGYPTTLAELDAWYLQPKGENAADVLLRAFPLFNNANSAGVPFVSYDAVPPLDEPLPKDMKAKAMVYLADNAKALQLLHEGAAIQECRFPVYLDPDPEVLLNHLGDITLGGKMLCLEAIVRASDGDSDAAAQSLKAILGLGRSLREEPLVVSQMHRINANSFARRAAEGVLSQVSISDGRLQELAALVETEVDQRCWERVVAGHTCIMNARCNSPQLLKALYRRHGGVGGGSNGPDPIDSEDRARMIMYRFSGLLKRDQLESLRLICRRVLPAAKRPYPDAIKTMNAVDKECHISVKPRLLMGEPVAAQLGAWLPNTFKTFAYDAAHLRMMRASFAVERYRLANGHLPEGLNALMPEYLKEVPADPFDGRPLRYKIAEKGYVIYSVGNDLKDDGGKESYWETEGDIALHVNR